MAIRGLLYTHTSLTPAGSPQTLARRTSDNSCPVSQAPIELLLWLRWKVGKGSWGTVSIWTSPTIRSRQHSSDTRARFIKFMIVTSTATSTTHHLTMVSTLGIIAQAAISYFVWGSGTSCHRTVSSFSFKKVNKEDLCHTTYKHTNVRMYRYQKDDDGDGDEEEKEDEESDEYPLNTLGRLWLLVSCRNLFVWFSRG